MDDRNSRESHDRSSRDSYNSHDRSRDSYQSTSQSHVRRVKILRVAPPLSPSPERKIPSLHDRDHDYRDRDYRNYNDRNF